MFLKNSPEAWVQLLTNEGVKNFLNIESNKAAELATNEMLLPDNINIFSFIENIKGLTDLGGSSKSTPSLQRFDLITEKPTGFPTWFVVAYPDAMAWYIQEWDKNFQMSKEEQDLEGLEIRNFKLLTGIDLSTIEGDATELEQKMSSFMEGNGQYYDIKVLKNLANSYKASGKQFETAEGVTLFAALKNFLK